MREIKNNLKSSRAVTGQPDFLETLPLHFLLKLAGPQHTQLPPLPSSLPEPALHPIHMGQHAQHQPHLVLLTPDLQCRHAHFPTPAGLRLGLAKTSLNTTLCLPRFEKKLTMFEHHKFGQCPVI